jgi:hypothetical protein
MKKALIGFFFVLSVIGLGAVLFFWWPYIFSKTVEGEIVKVEKLMDPIAVISRDGDPSNKVFSFAVGIKNNDTGEIFTSSTEDRQWAAAQSDGLCAEAKFYPYPPWRLDKAGTYFGARLIRLWECAKGKPD